LTIVRDFSRVLPPRESSATSYAEGVINKVKVIKRRAYGLPSFGGFPDRSF
jgi:transposase